MKKLVLVCALASFAFVGCKSKCAAPEVAEEAVVTEEVTEVPVDSNATVAACPGEAKAE